MARLRSINPVLRAVGVISAVTIMVSGVTFAALQSQVTLTDNTISTAGAASLLVDGSDEGTDGSPSEAGLSFTELVPGGNYSEPQEFRLINSADGPDMTITVNSTAAATSAPVDKNQVWVKFTLAEELPTEDFSTLIVGDSKEVTLAELESSFVNLPGASGEDRLDGNETLVYEVQVRVGAGAVSTTNVTIDDFDLVFTGTVVDDDEEIPALEPLE